MHEKITEEHKMELLREEKKQEKPEKQFAIVNSDKLNVRKAPNQKVLFSVSRGAKLQVLERRGEWSKICTSSGVEGYVMNKFLQF